MDTLTKTFSLGSNLGSFVHFNLGYPTIEDIAYLVMRLVTHKSQVRNPVYWLLLILSCLSLSSMTEVNK